MLEETLGQTYFLLLSAHQLLRDAVPHVAPGVAAAFEEELAECQFRLEWRERQFDGPVSA